MLFPIFFIMGVLSLNLVLAIRDCVNNKKKRLENILVLAAILTAPLAVDLFKNVISTNVGIKQQYDIFMDINKSQWTANDGNKSSYNNLVRRKETATDQLKSDLEEFIRQI